MNLTGEARIAAPPAVVWAKMVDLRLAPEYVPYLVAAEAVDAGPLAVGSTARLRFQGGGLQAAGTGTVTELQPEERLAIRIQVPEYHLRMDVTLTVAPDGTGSQVVELVEIAFTNLFLRTVGEGMLRQRDPEAHLRQGLERLRQLAEAAA